MSAGRPRFAAGVCASTKVARRMGSSNLFALFARVGLLCVVILALAGCDGDHRVGGPEGDLPPKALEGLLPRPALPELKVTCGERSVAGIRTGYSWTLEGNLKELDEIWPPPRASGDLLVTSGDSVALTITFPEGSLGVNKAKEAVSATLSAWDSSDADNANEPRPVYSDDCEVVELGSDSLSLSWAMPEMMALRREGNRHHFAQRGVRRDSAGRSVPHRAVCLLWTEVER